MARVFQREDWAMHPTRQSGEWEGGEANVSIHIHASPKFDTRWLE